MDEFFDSKIDQLELLVHKLKGNCIDCRTPCRKAHPSHTQQCDCCAWIEYDLETG